MVGKRCEVGMRNITAWSVGERDEEDQTVDYFRGRAFMCLVRMF